MNTFGATLGPPGLLVAAVTWLTPRNRLESSDARIQFMSQWRGRGRERTELNTLTDVDKAFTVNDVHMERWTEITGRMAPEKL